MRVVDLKSPTNTRGAFGVLLLAVCSSIHRREEEYSGPVAKQVAATSKEQMKRKTRIKSDVIDRASPTLAPAALFGSSFTLTSSFNQLFGLFECFRIDQFQTIMNITGRTDRAQQILHRRRAGHSRACQKENAARVCRRQWPGAREHPWIHPIRAPIINMDGAVRAETTE